MTIAKMVKDARERTGLTKAALADAAGLDKSYITYIESGAKVPSIEVLEKLAEAMGMDLVVRFEPCGKGGER